jgi:hypothetical protein
MRDKIPVCPICGGPMSLASTAYGRAWECGQQRGISRCPGFIPIADDEVLSELQLADVIARGTLGSSGAHQKEQARYRRVSGPLGQIAKSRYLSGAERRLLEDARAIVERLANPAALAKDRAKRLEKRREATRRERLALASFARHDGLLAWESTEDVEARLERAATGGKTRVDALLAQLVAAHQTLREDLAQDWSLRAEPIEDLRACLTEALPGLRAALLASPPVYLQAVRRLAESEADNVVRLMPRQAR